ncbi:MAG: hypothetical protein ABI877_05090, partial [Gemmatimonadaceae bacterium]
SESAVFIRSESARRSHFAAIALVLGAAVCVKLSAVALAGALFVAAAWVFWPELVRAPRAFAGSVLVPLAMGLVWMARGVVLSGYPIYPSSVLGVSVPWRVSTGQAAAETAWIRMSGHELNHNRIVAGYDWLLPWAKEIATDIRFAILVPLPAILAVVFGAMALFRARRRGEHAPDGRSAWMLLIPVLVGVAFWFFTAPHPRFGMGPMWFAAALSGALWFSTVVGDDASRRRQWQHVGFMIVAVSLLGVAMLPLISKGGASGLRVAGSRALGGLVFVPGPDHGFHPLAKAVLVSYTTASGLRLSVPRDNNLCWRGPLLCTPHPAPNLRLRNPDNVAEGFVADGNLWLPVRWPNPWTPFLPWLACRRAAGALGPGVGRDRACIAQTAKLPTDTLSRVTTPRSASDSTEP